MDSVLKSAKPRHGLTGSRNVVVHAWPGFTKVAWASRWQIRELYLKKLRFWHFWHNTNIKSDSDLWSYWPVNCICTKKYTVHCGSFRFSAGLKQVWHDIRDSPHGGYCLLTVEGWIGAKCVKYVWLSCPAQLSGWVLCISMQWLRLKACHVACDEYPSGEICSLQHMWVTSSVGNSHRSASPRPTTLEEEWELFVNFSLILYLWFEIQGLRTYNFFDWISNTGYQVCHVGSREWCVTKIWGPGGEPN